MTNSHFILLVLLLGSALPFYFFRRWSLRVMQPRRSGWRLLGWMVLMLGLIFLWVFLLVWIITQLFPRS